MQSRDEPSGRGTLLLRTMPQCKNSSSDAATPAPSRRFRCAVALYTLSLSLLAAGEEPGTGIDTREVYKADSPAWLQAVGRLQVPGSRYSDGRQAHLREDCSATLVTRLPGRQADILVTAWHCLENYRDLSKPIVFTLLPGQPGALVAKAYRLADGGGMYADWAILRLQYPVAATRVAALLVHPGRADPGREITMAGYSRDEGKGDGGNRLTFDPACAITGEVEMLSDSNCLAHKGASGGAVVQLSATGTPLFSGVISEGNGLGISRFVPVAAFRSALDSELE